LQKNLKGGDVSLSKEEEIEPGVSKSTGNVEIKRKKWGVERRGTSESQKGMGPDALKKPSMRQRSGLP